MENYILTKEIVAEKLHRMSLEIAEQLSEDDVPLILIGVKQSGIVMADKIYTLLKQYVKVPIQVISVSLDKQLPLDVTLSEPIDFNGKNVIVIDDVSNSGRTLHYAMKPLLNFFPKRIQTLVLVERMHKLFPVKPDYVGLSVATTAQDHIQVEVSGDEIVGAYVK
ncbi:MAG: phosphoribosyltransferase [Filimonas sp.]|nr:phosphoribosyltransferase [Filimonas sp.]